MVFLALWLVVKAGYTVVQSAVTHWRTTLGADRGWRVGVVVGLAPRHRSLAVAVAVGLVVWRWRHRTLVRGVGGSAAAVVVAALDRLRAGGCRRGCARAG